MKIGLHVVDFSWPDAPVSIAPTLRGIASAAEESGISHLSFMDHWFQMEWMAPATEPMMEGYTSLGFMAGLTSTTTLGLLVTGVTYRHPGLLAKTVATLDVLSGGRGELGIGAAWYEREHKGLGVPYPSTSERFERLEETLQICFQMWSDDDGPFKSKHYELAETICEPRPITQPRPSVMIGGAGERKTLRLVAQYADSCNLFELGTEEVAHKLDVLRRHCDDVGRDYSTITKTMLTRADAFSDTDAFVKHISTYADLGIDTAIFVPSGDAVEFTKKLGPVGARLEEI
jgi:F420-dependent oxidoreductase-like protein